MANSGEIAVADIPIKPIAPLQAIAPLNLAGEEEPEEPTSEFDVEGKPREWHTAFYYLAEHLRTYSGGVVNHKALYAYVGTDGRYINHDNPLVRKRTAGALSRIIHTKRYAADMCGRYVQNSLVFDNAARAVCEILRTAGPHIDAEVAKYLMEACWPDVRHGLENEKSESRPDLNMLRIDQEMKALLNKVGALVTRASTNHDSGATKTQYSLVDISGSPSLGTSYSSAVASETGASGGYATEVALGASSGYMAITNELSPAESLLSAIFHVIAFGNMDFTYARTLINENPTGALPRIGNEVSAQHAIDPRRACIIKFKDERRRTVENYWVVKAGSPFTIGRYTDCSLIESDQGISRIHGVVYRRGGVWFYEDMSSRNGSRIVDSSGKQQYESSKDGTRKPIELHEGDMIVLAERTFLWFGSLSDEGEM